MVRKGKIFCRMISIVMIVTLGVSLCACDNSISTTNTPSEQPHLYWKDIDVVVTNVSRKEWFATVPRRSLNVTVESEEYGLSKSFTMESSGMFNTIDCWDCQEGDTIKAELYSWVMDSTGEVTRREIHKLY